MGNKLTSKIHKYDINKLYEEYKTGITVKEIAEKYDFKSNTLFHWFRKNGLKLRNGKDRFTPKLMDQLRPTMFKKGQISWSKGQTKDTNKILKEKGLRQRKSPEEINICADGYLYIRLNTKRIFLHRLLWEKYNNRKIPNGYVVHHMDGNKSNNKKENLELQSRAEHAKEHYDRQIKEDPTRVLWGDNQKLRDKKR